MSNSSTNASVNLLVNGKQAEETLRNLKKHALDLTEQIAKAAAAGDKVKLEKFQRELKKTTKQIKQIESSTMQVENVLKRLDKTSPHELQQTLRTLNQQLDKMERGSAAWTAQVEKIRLVKNEIAKVNGELARSQTFWQRLNNNINNYQTAVMGAIAAFTGLVLAGRKAVQAYADMDEQLANTRKYTGMTVDEVLRLNDAFKKMDPRTGRDALNELAQEAGRLGFTTREDVQGYVEAADIINVALCDLREGATQTIAKLSSIFRINEEMTTKEAMLSVGSAVNVLSQNCTANKQYLVDFTQRMAGVGATAKMSIPEILAFAATLDANGQKCEMSASNLGKLIMMLYQKPKELATAVGIDVEKFNKTLKTSTNDALLMFLERIQQMGSDEGLSRLAPLFAEMQMSGVRMSQVLATLSNHLDMVKWEQGEANKAFNEATSATREYTIFNNTAQAGIDKAVKRFKELTITLGESLLPVMKHVLTTSSMTMRLLNQLVNFVKQYYREILTLTAAIVAYKVAINAALIKEKLHLAVVTAKTAALHLHKVAVLLASAAYNKLTHHTVRANAAIKLLHQTMKLSPWGLLAAAIAAVVTGLVMYIRKSRELSAEQKALNDIKSQAAKSVGEETQRLNTLIAAAENERLTLEERKKAVAELNKIIPNYNSYIDETTGKYIASKNALDDYLVSLSRKYEVEGAQAKLQELGAQKAELALQRQEAEQDVSKAKAQSAATYTAPSKVTTGGAGGAPVVGGSIVSGIDLASATNKLNAVNDKLKEIEKTEKTIFSIYGEEMQKQTLSTINPTEEDDEEDDPLGGAEAASKNKFQAEDDWKERENALNRIAYAKGLKDYETYNKDMLQIEVEYNKKKLDHTDLVGNEQVTIQASYYEALKKLQDNALKGTIEDENAAYQQLQAGLQQRYADGEVTARQYQTEMELLELEHLKNIVSLYQDGSKEKLKAEKQYHETSLKYQMRHVQEDKRLQEQFRQQYFDKAFRTEDKEGYQTDLRNLNLVHQQMLQAAGNNKKARLKIDQAYYEARYKLARKYNIKESKDMVNAWRKGIDDSVEWLNSDGGQAFVGSMDAIVGQMSAIFSQLSDLIQAECDLQTAQIEKKYAAEISAAEGNKSQEVFLEKQKEAEIAKAKQETNRKMFAMQVIQAIAQTATAAIAAYSSAAAIPMVGFVMAPIAAAMAVAAGGLQIAAIKKQQQASEAQGYAKGGFTPKGRKYEEVGVVHAGEWVASQELLANPTARAIINTLDYAQRTNTIGNLKGADVSRSLTAPTVLAQAAQSGELNRTLMSNTAVMHEYAKTMAALNTRLNEPFVTVNTVTGDVGIKQAQDEYSQLIKNKTPKSRL